MDQLVDTTNLMYGVFQCCRAALRRTPEALNLIDEILKIIKQQETFIITVSDEWVKKIGTTSSIVDRSDRSMKDIALSPANQALFSLICVGATEFRRLWEAGASDAVRHLGYAFHNVPALLRTPDKFLPTDFLGNMGRHWDEYSLEMKQAICDIKGISLQEAETRLKSDTS